MILDDKTAQFSTRIHDIYAHPPGQTSENNLAIGEQELRALVHMNLGEGYSPEKISAIVEGQRKLRVEHKELINRLKEGQISATECFNQLQALLSNVADGWEPILGKEDFVKLFGVPAKAAAGLLELDRR